MNTTATGPAVGRKEDIWLACKEKTCCYTPFVIPTGRDVWRIARTLDTPPWAFLVYFAAPAPRRDSFILDHGQQPFRLALGKQVSRRRKAPPPCVFLLRTRNGYHRCGLGDLRPGVCQAFPSNLSDGILCVSAQSGCSCRVWNLSDVDIAEETALVKARQADSEEYCAVVGQWNERVLAAPPGATFTFFNFCDFLLTAYDALPCSTGRGAERE